MFLETATCSLDSSLLPFFPFPSLLSPFLFFFLRSGLHSALHGAMASVGGAWCWRQSGVRPGEGEHEAVASRIAAGWWASLPHTYSW